MSQGRRYGGFTLIEVLVVVSIMGLLVAILLPSLKQARQQAGLTQEQLAKMLQTKKTAISRIENHAQDIKLSTIQKVAKALGKSLEITLS